MSHPAMKIAVFGLALCASITANAQDKPADFASQTPLSLSGEGPWYRLELPLGVQLNARQTDLGDLRVFNAEGQPQAYAITPRQPAREQEPAPIPVKWFALYSTQESGDATPVIRIERSSSGSVIEVQPQSDIEAGEEVLRGWLLDTSAIKAPLEQLIIDWSTEREGFQNFSIEASDDLQHWRDWGEGQIARLSFADEVVEQREVGLPGQSARYLRLLWRAPHSAPLLISAHLLSASSDMPTPPLTWSPPVKGSVESPNEYVWQLPAGLPIGRVKVDITQPNSLAPAILYGRTDSKQPWQPISSGLLYRLSQNNSDVLQDQLQLPGRVVQQLKLVVDDRGGGLGNEAPQLSVAVPATEVVFLARGNGPFTLAVGNSTAKAANLSLATLIPDYSAAKLASLGTAKPATASIADMAAAPVQVAPQGTDFKRLGLWAVLLLGVLFLGWMAFSTLRTSKR
ncbi:Membrane protein [Pseudomonas coronafaciens pv. oryzae]|nr:Membrane protein [Pseudomonas coronafaciens pv. oryzae]KPY07377.1 Membrane protein [Pseudomonas coronafaciens pv. oryzae]RMT07689.1 Membrane protein [Pseudomonas coronafaciens pv. oryzae]